VEVVTDAAVPAPDRRGGPAGAEETVEAEQTTGPENGKAPEPSNEPNPVPLLAPRDGTPHPIEDLAELREVAAALAAGTGPVGIDAERASGYRYGQRAYLVQLRRNGAGTFLVDPLRFDAPTDIGDVLDALLADTEWVLHAASQDLPCLAELGLRPRRLFDTELAGRLAGFPRVGLAALVERLLGFTLEKGHSAADWSTRPLPKSWLTYAALDVELLVELRDALAAELDRQGKRRWAEEEFAALAAAPPPKPRTEPWRRTSGIHKVRTPRGLARVRALWEERDAIAQARDLAPGRVLPDSAIVAAAQADPADERALLTLPVFSGRATRRLASRFAAALARARETVDVALPAPGAAGDGPPPPHRWADRDPVAAARLVRCRRVVTDLATARTLPPENLLTPDTVRRLAWTPPSNQSSPPDSSPDTAAVAAELRRLGARDWQVRLTAEPLAAALAEPAPPPVP
jgi:ribonuclease D